MNLKPVIHSQYITNTFPGRDYKYSSSDSRDTFDGKFKGTDEEAQPLLKMHAKDIEEWIKKWKGALQ